MTSDASATETRPSGASSGRSTIRNQAVTLRPQAHLPESAQDESKSAGAVDSRDSRGLVDEPNLLVHPILVGNGNTRLFPPDEPSIHLKPQSAETIKTGVLNLSYSPTKD